MAIQLRRGTNAQWEALKGNIVVGELATTTDTERAFLGTGNGTYFEMANIDLIADEFDSSVSYASGDCCIQQGKLYQFTSAHNGAWTGSDVEQITIGDIMGDNIGDSVPSTVRSAILALFEAAAYAETGLGDEIAVIESWASEVTSISLSADTLSINGDTPQTLVATTVPTGSTVVWSSSDDTIATVTNGVVTGVSNGNCTITASAGNKSATCAVTVTGFATLESISAVYTQSGTVYDTDSLDSLKSDLVVTATYSDSTTATVPSTAYTLSGTLTEGTSTITVLYGGKTTTFTVNVTEAVELVSISAVYTQSGTVHDTDSLDSLKADLVVTATYSDSTTETVPSTDYTLSGTLAAGTSTITVSYGGKTATFSVTVSDMYHLALTDGDFQIQAGAISWDSTHDVYTNTSSNSLNGRRNIYVNDGPKPYFTTTDNATYTITDPPQYPIPIPADATSVTYTVTPSTQFMGVRIISYNSSTDKYSNINDIGWKQGSYTQALTASANKYLTMALKYNSAGSTYPTEPSEITIDFGE